MERNRFPYASWDEERRPIEDEVLDAQRRQRYWEWNAIGLFEDLGTRLVEDLADGRSWRELVDVSGADFEAFHMQHSVGYNWDHYSGMGRLISLRERDGVPSATVLVAGGTIVHARRRDNEPLTDAALADVRSLARSQGWSMLEPEQL